MNTRIAMNLTSGQIRDMQSGTWKIIIKDDKVHVLLHTLPKRSGQVAWVYFLG